MRFTEDMTRRQKDDLSRGFDRGNYGNAYESQNWEAWSKRIARKSDHYRMGALLGFFSSYEIDEISDEELADEVRTLRARHDYDACATCGASLPDDYLRATAYATRTRACPDGCEER